MELLWQFIFKTLYPGLKKLKRFVKMIFFPPRFYLFGFVLTGWLKHPISQSVCGESVWSSSHSGDDSSWLLQGQVVHPCLLWKNAEWTLNTYDTTAPLSPSPLLSFHPFLVSPCIVFRIASSETATSPWWLGSAARVWRFGGSTVSRTTPCSACARPPPARAQRWAVPGCPISNPSSPRCSVYL